MTEGPILKGQIAKISKLVDRVGVGAYRDAKKTLGIGRMKNIKSLTRYEAKALIINLRKAGKK